MCFTVPEDNALFINSLCLGYYCTIEFSCLCDVVLTPSGLTLRRKTRRLLYVGDES
jgi:hypothetical protein